MKKTSILLAICCLMAFASCQKKNAKQYLGDYSFKTSGSVTATSTYTTDHHDFTVNLKDEIGQLQISTLDRKNDSVVVVMNFLDGEAIVTHGYCNDNEIILKKFKRSSISFSYESFDVGTEVEVYAKGSIYDDNMIIFNMIYDGETKIGPITYDIYGDDIRMVATRN